MLVDTHCHLNDREKFADVQAEIRAALDAGVKRLIVVGTKPSEWASSLALAEAHKELFCILGWHPNYTSDFDLSQLESLSVYANSAKCLAIGEIGLDYHWDYSPRETQRKALLAQLDLADQLELPVVFHAREAYSDLLDILELRPGRAYLFHCFAGSQEDALRAIALDAYFGVDGPITYKNASQLRHVISGLPKDRLLLETDAPYLSPEPFRGKTNRPAHVPLINKSLATLLELTEDECALLTSSNAARFFGQALLL